MDNALIVVVWGACHLALMRQHLGHVLKSNIIIFDNIWKQFPKISNRSIAAYK